MQLNHFQKRFSLICLGVLVILIASWFLAFKKTWESYAELKRIESGLNKLETSKKTILNLTYQLEEIQLDNGQSPDSSNIQTIFKRISDLSDVHEKTRIVSFPEIHSHHFKKYNISTLEIELEGDYKNLLKFIHDLEDERNIGRIVSTSFDLQKDLRTKKEYLRLKIYIQNTQKLTRQNEETKSI